MRPTVLAFPQAFRLTAGRRAMYAPARVTSRRTPAPRGNDTGAEALHRAAGHGDEHVIKFTDTAVDAFDSCGDPGLLAAAGLAREMISRP